MRAARNASSVAVFGVLILSVGCTVDSPTATSSPIGGGITAKLAKYDGKQLRFSTYAKGKDDFVPHLYSSDRVSLSYDPTEHKLRVISSGASVRAEPRDTFTTVLPVMWQEEYSEIFGDLWTGAVTDTVESIDSIPLGYFGVAAPEITVDSAPDARAIVVYDRDGKVRNAGFELGEEGAVGYSELHYDGNGEFTGITITIMIEGTAYITELSTDNLSLEPTAESHRLAAIVIDNTCADAWMDLAVYGTVATVETALGGMALRRGVKAAVTTTLEFINTNAGTAVLPVSRGAAKAGLAAIAGAALYAVVQPYYETFKAARTLYRNDCF